MLTCSSVCPESSGQGDERTARRGVLCGDLSGLITATFVCLGFLDISQAVLVLHVSWERVPGLLLVTQGLFVRLILEFSNFLFRDLFFILFLIYGRR